METVDLNIKDLRHMLLTVSKLRGSDQKKKFSIFCIAQPYYFVLIEGLDL